MGTNVREGGGEAAFSVYVMLTYIKIYACYVCLRVGVHVCVPCVCARARALWEPPWVCPCVPDTRLPLHGLLHALTSVWTSALMHLHIVPPLEHTCACWCVPSAVRVSGKSM